MTDWKGGKIDKNYTSSDRLSVGFNSKLETHKSHLLNWEEFDSIWKSKWGNSETIKKFPATEDEIKNTIQMDYIFYRAILKHVYNQTSFEELDANIKKLDPIQLE
jgi:hypothetical protein